MKLFTFYKSLIVFLLAAAFLPAAVQAQTWYNNSWAYRKAITIDYTKVGTGPHTNFPVLISITDANLQTGAQATANDILFTSSDGATKLAHEIESYTSGTGALVAWVQVPSVSSSVNTVIYMYYGNTTATNQQNVTGTWDANFKGVYHLNGVFTDATSNANNGTNTGTISATGKISGAREFDPSNGADKITITGLMGSPVNSTISGWGTLDARDVNGSALIAIGDYNVIKYDDGTDGCTGFYYNSTATWQATSVSPVTHYAATGWHYIVYTINDAGNAEKLYVDGVLKTTSAYIQSITYSGQGTNTFIGCHGNGSTNFDFDGIIDEVRVASTDRSAGWILTEYNNQNAPSTFYSVGTQTTTKTFTGTGNFSDATKWTGGTLPIAGDNLIIDGTCTVDNAAGTDNIAYGTLTIGTATGRTLSWASGGTNRLNVSNVSAGAGASTLNMTNGGTLIIRGTWTSTNLTFTPGTGTIEVRSALTLPAAYATFNNLVINGAGITVKQGVATALTGNLTITAGTFDANNLNTTAGANWVNNGSFTAGTGSVTFTGAGTHSVTGTSTTAFNNIIVNKGTDYTSNILDVQSLITMTAGGLTLINGTFKLSSNSTITAFTVEIVNAPYNIPATTGLWVNGGTVSTDNNMSFAGLVHVSNGILNVGDASDERFNLRTGGVVIVDGGTVNVSGRLTYLNNTDIISFTMSAGTFNVGVVGNTINFSAFNIAAVGSTFNMSGGTIVIVKPAASNFGYFNLAGNSTITGGTLQIGTAATPAGSIVSVISTPPLWNLTINSTNTPTMQLGSSLVIYNDVTIGGGLNANGYNMTVGRNWINNGTFTPGSTTVTFNGTTVMSGTTTSNTFNNLTVAASSTVTSSTGITGLVVNGTLTTGASAILDLGTTTVLSGALGTIANSGTIKTSVPSTTSAVPIPAGKTWGGSIDYTNVNGDQTLVDGTYNNLIARPGLNKTSTAGGNLVVNGTLTNTTTGGSIDLSTFVLSGTLTGIANTGFIKTAVPTTTSATPIPAGKTWSGTGTLEYTAVTGAQTVVNGTYTNLKLSNTSGTNTAGGNITVQGVFTLSGGTITTGASSVYLNATGTVARTGGHVIGNFKKYITTGATNATFEIGDATNYTPVSVSFASVTTAGDLTAVVTATDHPNLSGSGIRTDKSVNRYYSLTNSGIVYTTYGLTINWVAANVDAGSATANFRVGNYNNPTWTFPAVASPLATAIQATGLSSFGDFAVGELCSLSAGFSYTGSPYCSSTTTATPTLTGTAGTFTSTAGLSINAVSGVINPAASTGGTYTVTNSATSAGGCAASSTASITITPMPTTSNAGADQTGVATCGLTSVALAGNTATTGTGAWSIISGTGGTVTTPASATSAFTGTSGTTYTLRWTISNSVCTPSTDDVVITFNQNPTASNAGADQSGTSCGLTVTLAGNTPATGTGAWSIISGTGGTVTTPASPTSTFAGTVGTTYTLQWTISNSVCTPSTDDVLITIVAGTWSGAVSTNWNTAGNWLCGAVPTTSTIVVIPGSLSNYPVLNTGVGAVQQITIQSGASLTVTGATLKIAGTISNSGTFTASSGTIEMNGSTVQTIPAATFAGKTINSLTINNTAGVTLADTLKLTGDLTVSTGALTTGGFLVLKSSATATARVAQITSAAGTPISGNVTVERYIPGRRKYRLITSAVTTHANATLTAGQEAYSIWGQWQNGGVNTTPNVGNLITGGSVADGFDAGTTNASLYTYDDVNRVFTGFTTANGKNTKYTSLKAGVGYLMFVYGDRQNSVYATSPHNTVLTTTGTLKTGNQAYTTSSDIPLSGVTGRFTLLGNPFASPINWATVPKTNLDNTYWGWDPNLSSTGGYITVTTAGTVTLQAPYSGSTGLNQYIQPGQAFFVKTAGASPVLTIREQDKVSNFNGNAFRTDGTASDVSLLAINLQYTSSGSKVLADGVLVAFDDAFSNQAGAEDASKMANGGESIAILNDTTSLSIDTRQMPQNNDTLYLTASRLTKAQYTWQIFAQQMNNAGILAYLQDRYLNTLQVLSLSDTNNIVFDVNTAIPASADINRFRIVFRSVNVILPVTYTSITASLKNKDIQIDWQVAEESGIQQYEIEKSVDGINFSKVAAITAKGNSTESYHWLDVNCVTGSNYYRVRAVQMSGRSLVSKIVGVKTKVAIKIFPNPVKDKQVNIRADEMEKGQYVLQLNNPQGQQIIYRTIEHRGGVFAQTIYLGKMLPAGSYYLQIANEKEKYGQMLFIE